MKRYQCTCLLEEGEKYCPVHKKKMNRNFWKREDEEQHVDDEMRKTNNY
jgi:hypothetical protein